MKKWVLFNLLAHCTLFAQAGIIGGRDNGSPIAYFVDAETGATTPITGLAPTGTVFSVDLSDTGTAIIAGNSFAYTADIGTTIAGPISGVSTTALFLDAAISDNGTIGLLGGSDGGDPFAYVVDIPTNTANLIGGISPSAITISQVAINSTGTIGLLGGGDIIGNGAFAYKYDVLSNTTTNIPLVVTGQSRVLDVAIDAAGNFGLIAVQPVGIDPEAYIANLGSSTASPITFPVSIDFIGSVAINDPGTIGLLGGVSAGGPVAFKVEIPSGNLTNIPLPGGTVTDVHVAIDAFGTRGLIGIAASIPSAFSVDLTTNTLTPISGLPATAQITSVAIQDSGKAGLIGGSNGTLPFALLVPDLINNPSFSIPLNLGAVTNGFIFSVDFGSLLSSIPTAGLTGNNLRLANYLNEFAPDTASFFIPSELNGNLASALESVAPTRNATPLFALNNNFFALRQSFTQRASDARQTHEEESQQEELSLLASRYDDCCYIKPCRNNTLWGQFIGFDAYQDRQNQTPSFHPWSIGFVLGYDYGVTRDFRVGGTVAYMYTHLHQNNDQGHDNINQEYLSLYGLWETSSLYANMALWFGLYQTDRTRNISLDEFEFRATSSSFGYQLDPHLELGYDYRFCNCAYTIEPFVMFDWIHNWQSSFRESGTGPFLFRQNSLHASVFRTETGLRFYQTFHFCSWNLILEETGSYIYRKPYSIGDVTGALIGAPGTLSLVTFTDAQNLGSAGLVFVFEPVYSCYPVSTIAYKGEFGSGYQSHLVSIGVEWSF